MRLCQLPRVWSQPIRIGRCFPKLETFDIVCNLPLSSNKSTGCIKSISIIASSAVNRTRKIQRTMSQRVSKYTLTFQRFQCQFCCRKLFKLISWLEKHIQTYHSDILHLVAETKDAQDEYHIAPASGDSETDHTTISSKEPGPATVENDLDARNSDLESTDDESEAEANTSDDFTDEAKVFEDSGKSQGCCVVFSEDNPWYPFANEKEFALAKWFIDSGVPKSRIDEYFNLGLAGSPEDGIISFRSAYSLYKLIDKMDPLLGMESFKYDTVDFGIPGRPASPYFYRDPVEVVQYLLKQPAYSRHMVYSPEEVYTTIMVNGEKKKVQVYSEMHTGKWWWKEQSTLPRGATLVPVICMSDETHLSDFSGDKKA